MKYIILLLLSLNLKAELDLTIPKQSAVHIPEKEFFFNWGDYNEPPTKAQIITFWTLNVLDVYTNMNVMNVTLTYSIINNYTFTN